ncbi:MAG: DUF3866 family protein [Armatimonadota bacterium]|nr:DUF3866 family protein [Armatimonadota bacterium]
MLSKAIGTVTAIGPVRDSAIEMEVDVEGSKARAIAYPCLTGPVAEGDRVLLNTTAVNLSLGTGGCHFVIANLSREPGEEPSEPGHIMKLRYTPLQRSVLSVEEEDSAHRDAIERFTSLDGLPVIVGQLHSQIAPAAAAVKRLSHPSPGSGPVRVAYCMTEGAALPIGFSRLVEELKNAGLIDVTITAGQAFGGDLEAVNVYTGLIAAKEVAQADAVIVCQGPGNVGTGTTFGYSGIEQGEIINAVNILGGRAIAVPRVSFADPRPRHRGISHHTITALTKIALTPAIVALPVIEEMKLNLLEEQLARSGATLKHKVRVLDGSPAIDELRAKGVSMNTMGRGYEDDPEFFLAAAAAGAAAAQFVTTR